MALGRMEFAGEYFLQIPYAAGHDQTSAGVAWARTQTPHAIANNDRPRTLKVGGVEILNAVGKSGPVAVVPGPIK